MLQQPQTVRRIEKGKWIERLEGLDVAFYHFYSRKYSITDECYAAAYMICKDETSKWIILIFKNQSPLHSPIYILYVYTLSLVSCLAA